MNGDAISLRNVRPSELLKVIRMIPENGFETYQAGSESLMFLFQVMD